MQKMMPIGPLMIEHRLIEKMIDIMDLKLKKIKESKDINPFFIYILIDFIKTYADNCHHGKEEDILFRELKKKPLSTEYKRIMEELVEEHKTGRIITGKLVEAHNNYLAGDQKALNKIIENMNFLINFYPKHIEKEDKHFFIPVMNYFTEEEKNSMLYEGFEFDQKLIHIKYKNTVEQIGLL